MKNGRRKNEKGQFQYIKRRRFRQGMLSLLGFVLVFVIYFVGYLMNKRSNANVFTIIAVLAVLPTVKVLISFLILVPFHSVEKEQYDEIRSLVPDQACFYTDYVFTSPEKIMMLDFIVVSNGGVIGYVKKSDHIECMKKYLLNGLRVRNIGYMVELYTDYNKFKQKVSELDYTIENDLENYKEVKDYIHCLLV